MMVKLNNVEKNSVAGSSSYCDCLTKYKSEVNTEIIGGDECGDWCCNEKLGISWYLKDPINDFNRRVIQHGDCPEKKRRLDEMLVEFNAGLSCI